MELGEKNLSYYDFLFFILLTIIIIANDFQKKIAIMQLTLLNRLIILISYSQALKN